MVFSVTQRGEQEVEQVVGAARLGADARELETTKRLAIDQRAGDASVDVEIADAELAFDSFDIGRAARV